MTEVNTLIFKRCLFGSLTSMNIFFFAIKVKYYCLCQKSQYTRRCLSITYAGFFFFLEIFGKNDAKSVAGLQ